jgi:hypothetical protein
MPFTVPFLWVVGGADCSAAVEVCRHNRDPKLRPHGLAAFSHQKHSLPKVYYTTTRSRFLLQETILCSADEWLQKIVSSVVIALFLIPE